MKDAEIPGLPRDPPPTRPPARASEAPTRKRSTARQRVTRPRAMLTVLMGMPNTLGLTYETLPSLAVGFVRFNPSFGGVP